MLAARAQLTFRANNLAAVAAGLAFAGFVCAKGVPTLRHDWSWPIDRAGIPFFFSSSFDGWLSTGFGIANTHPTLYLLALPIVPVMWLFGPLFALGLLAFVIGALCMRAVAAMGERWRSALPASIGLGLFALFNPWVYNQVVAGHLAMVLAYAASIGLLTEMLRGASASPLRLGLWLVLIATQLQFFILAMLALAVFASVTKKWQPLVVGALVVLPSAIGVLAERSALRGIPYTLTWQANQSIDPVALLSLGGYFAGYADRLGLTAQIAVWITFAVALAGVVLAARRSRAAIWAAVGVAALYVAILGLRGPGAAPYEWLVRDVPETAVFRELYDLAGVLAALLVLLACAAAAAWKPIGYIALAAGAALAVMWAVAPPSDFWISARSYPRPRVLAPPFTRVALLPAFQPVGLRDGGGAGADPDVSSYPGDVSVLNEYFPTYPVDMALARYEQDHDAAALRALGVGEIVTRPWLASRSNGRIGLAAPSLAPSRRLPSTGTAVAVVNDATPLISNCETPRVVLLPGDLDACNIFFGDTAQYGGVYPLETLNDSIDPRTDWIDARLAFGEVPSLAQGIGGTLTQSHLPHPVDPGAWLLVYVHGILTDSAGRVLTVGQGGFRWVALRADAKAVQCVGLCELVAQTRALPNLPARAGSTSSWACDFRKLAPWLYVIKSGARPARLLRLNERYDPGWIAIDGWRVLPHLRVDMAVNGWLYRDQSSTTIVLLQATSLLQLIGEFVGILCVVWLLKALVTGGTKRAA